MVLCLERGADLHTAQLMPLPLTVSCFSNIQIGFTFLVAAHPGSPGQRAVKRVCVCMLVCGLVGANVRLYLLLTLLNNTLLQLLVLQFNSDAITIRRVTMALIQPIIR